MRMIDADAAKVLSRAGLSMVLLVYMGLTEPLYLTSATRKVIFGGNEYLALGHLGAVDPVDDKAGSDNKSLKFTLSGVPNELLAISLQENIRSRPVSVRIAILHPITHDVIDAPTIWSGTLDQMPIQSGAESSVITVTAEHRGSTFARPKPIRYTDNDQRRLFPGDTSLRFIVPQSTHQDVWPSAAWGRQ